jgi:hypothetical protein
LYFIREKTKEEQLTVGFRGFLEIMNCCEEVYAKQKEMHMHTLFSRRGKDRYTPIAEYDPDKVPIAWVDKLKQYTGNLL